MNRDANWTIFGFCLIVMFVLHEATEVSALAETDLLWTSVIFVSTNYRIVEASRISSAKEGAINTSLRELAA